jgi:copper(I)-binding protein
MGRAVTERRASIMLRNAARASWRGPSRSPLASSGLARGAVAALAVALGAALSGCAVRAEASGPVMELATAYVGAPQNGEATDAYLVIRNNGAADQLVSARTSAGGTVTLHGPAGTDGPQSVSSIRVPGHTMIRLDPNSYHLVITGAGPMKAGADITLTLTFARSGSFSVPAEVTNPQTGGSSYFLN